MVDPDDSNLEEWVRLKPLAVNLGLNFPLSKLVCDLLCLFNISLCQLPIKSWKHLLYLEVVKYVFGVKIGLVDVRYCYIIQTIREIQGINRSDRKEDLIDIKGAYEAEKGVTDTQSMPRNFSELVMDLFVLIFC